MAAVAFASANSWSFDLIVLIIVFALSNAVWTSAGVIAASIAASPSAIAVSNSIALIV